MLNPTGQAPTGDETDARALEAVGDPRLSADADKDWDRFGHEEDPEALYLAEGESNGPASGADPSAAPATNPAPESLDEVDLSSLSLADRAATVKAYLGVEIPDQKALEIADGYMRNRDYTQSKQTLAEQQRMTQQLLQQAGITSPQTPALNGLPLPAQPPAAPEPAQSAVPGPPVGTVEPWDRDGFVKWWEENMDRPPKQADLDRWQYDVTHGQLQRQQAQQQLEGTVQQAQGEWEQLEQEFKHTGEPGVREAVEAEVVRRLQAGIAGPGMVREIYLGKFADKAFARNAVATQPPPRQAPPVPPGGPGGAPRQQPEPDLRSDDGILAKQLSDEGFLSRIEGTLVPGEESIYEQFGG